MAEMKVEQCDREEWLRAEIQEAGLVASCLATRALPPAAGESGERGGMRSAETKRNVYIRALERENARLRAVLGKMRSQAWLNTSTNQGHAELAEEVDAVLNGWPRIGDEGGGQ